MKITIWGTRGSLATPGPETARYGGNTSCVQIEGADGTMLILDAGSGLRRLNASLPSSLRRVDILMTHLHMDHIQGLGFFAPLRVPGIEVHLWGPASATLSLRDRLSRYLSPPLFPVYLREMDATRIWHEVPCGPSQVGEFLIESSLVCHPDPTVGYRISNSKSTLTYIPDHEPALGAQDFPIGSDWTSGYALAEGADLLIHDSQYSIEEYEARVGWGHSSVPQAFAFAQLAEVKRFMPFHHDPGHTDDDLDLLFRNAAASFRPSFQVSPAMEGATITLGS